MGTLNGIGTHFYGIKGPDSEGNCVATSWFTFLYFPIIPLNRIEMVRLVTRPYEFKYHVISKQPLKAKEVFTTYLFGWVITPILWLWPMPFAIREVAEKIGYTNENAEGTLYNCITGFAIIYMLAFVWKWKDWDEKQGLPKNHKEILKEQAKTATNKI